MTSNHRREAASLRDVRLVLATELSTSQLPVPVDKRCSVREREVTDVAPNSSPVPVFCGWGHNEQQQQLRRAGTSPPVAAIATPREAPSNVDEAANDSCSSRGSSCAAIAAAAAAAAETELRLQMRGEARELSAVELRQRTVQAVPPPTTNTGNVHIATNIVPVRYVASSGKIFCSTQIVLSSRFQCAVDAPASQGHSGRTVQRFMPFVCSLVFNVHAGEDCADDDDAAYQDEVNAWLAGFGFLEHVFMTCLRRCCELAAVIVQVQARNAQHAGQHVHEACEEELKVACEAIEQHAARKLLRTGSDVTMKALALRPQVAAARSTLVTLAAARQERSMADGDGDGDDAVAQLLAELEGRWLHAGMDEAQRITFARRNNDKQQCCVALWNQHLMSLVLTVCVAASASAATRCPSAANLDAGAKATFRDDGEEEDDDDDDDTMSITAASLNNTADPYASCPGSMSPQAVGRNYHDPGNASRGHGSNANRASDFADACNTNTNRIVILCDDDTVGRQVLTACATFFKPDAIAGGSALHVARADHTSADKFFAVATDAHQPLNRVAWIRAAHDTDLPPPTITDRDQRVFVLRVAAGGACHAASQSCCSVFRSDTSPPKAPVHERIMPAAIFDEAHAATRSTCLVASAVLCRELVTAFAHQPAATITGKASSARKNPAVPSGDKQQRGGKKCPVVAAAAAASASAIAVTPSRGPTTLNAAFDLLLAVDTLRATVTANAALHDRVARLGRMRLRDVAQHEHVTAREPADQACPCSIVSLSAATGNEFRSCVPPPPPQCDAALYAHCLA
jgi:hypothetical protein